jgi:hypothetical protein
MELRLTCTILALATISLQSPKKITQEWSKWGVRGLSLAFRQFWLKNKQERKNERGYGGIYTPSPGDSGYTSGYSGQLVRTFRIETRTLRVRHRISQEVPFERWDDFL